ncbi:MAG: hypothetical protein ACQEQ0_12300 [Bacteroidota bacterium]
MFEKLEQLDAEYRNRTAHLGGKAEQKQCAWQDCQLDAASHGFCKTCYLSMTRGGLIRLNLDDRTHEAKAALFLEFQEIAESFDMTPDELLTAAFFTVLKEGRK